MGCVIPLLSDQQYYDGIAVTGKEPEWDIFLDSFCDQYRIEPMSPEWIAFSFLS